MAVCLQGIVRQKNLKAESFKCLFSLNILCVLDDLTQNVIDKYIVFTLS